MQAEHEQKLRKWSPFVVEPIAMEADATGHLWVVDAAGSGVIRIDLSLEHDRCTGIAAQTSRPIGLGWKGKNSLPLDYTHGRGVASLVLQIPTDVALDRAGDILYVVDAGEQRVEAYRVAEIGGDKEVEPAFTFGGFGRENGRFVRPTGICAGVDGFVYVTDEGGHRVLKFDEKGTFVAEWGKQGLGQVEFYKPRGITQGADGKLYVVDYGNHRGQVLTSDGGFVVAFGARLFTQPTRTAK
jgi:sugar lactone lactonase YvrE